MLLTSLDSGRMVSLTIFDSSSGKIIGTVEPFDSSSPVELRVRMGGVVRLGGATSSCGSVAKVGLVAVEVVCSCSGVVDIVAG